MRRVRLLNETRRNRIIVGASPLRSTPLTIWGANLIAWYSAKDSGMYEEATPVTPVSDASPIGYIEDLSGNGYHLTQSTAANKPTYDADHASFNNQPTATFDGGDWMSVAFSGLVSQPTTIFCLGRMSNLLANYNFYDGDDASNRQLLQHNTDGADIWRAYAGTVLDKSSSDTTVHGFAVIFNGASSKLYVDGGTPASGNAGAAGIDGLVWGSRYDKTVTTMVGDQSEWFLVDRAATTSEIDQIFNQWATDYGISVTPAV